MRHGKAGISASLAAVLVAMLATACSGGNEDSATTPLPSQSGGPTQKEEPIELLWLGNPGATPLTDDTQGQKYIEDKFNVKIKVMRLDPSSPDEQLNINLANKVVPDVFWLTNSDPLTTYASQGILAELPVALIKEKMPEYAKTVDDMDPGLWQYGLYNGKSYGIPQYWDIGNTPMLTGYNKKWLQAIGYAQPPKTLQEFEDVLYKFRNNDPDGNGKKDTYGMSAAGKDNLTISFLDVFGAFSTNWSNWIEDKNGNLVFGMTTEGARQSFKLINKWFKDGVIDSEFITTDSTLLNKKFFDGQVGMISSHWQAFYGTGAIGNPAKKAGLDIAYGKPLAGPDGPGANFAYGAKNAYLAMGAQVAKDPKKMDKIFEIMRAVTSQQDVYLRVAYGQEGIHWDMVDGVPVQKPEFVSLDAQRKIGIASFFRLFSGRDTTFEKFYYPPDKLAFRDQLVGGSAKQVTKVAFTLPSLSKYPDLPKLQEEYFMKFVLGNVDLDKGFDDFVQLWKKSGGQVLTDEANSIYKATAAAK